MLNSHQFYHKPRLMNMSEMKISYALKYEDGRYLSWNEKNFPLTSHLKEARRFMSNEQIADFLAYSFYRPEVYGMDPADFEIVEVEISYREVKRDEREHEGIRESKVCS